MKSSKITSTTFILEGVAYNIISKYSDSLKQWISKIKSNQELKGRVEYLGKIQSMGDTLEESLESFECDCAYYYINMTKPVNE